VENVSTEANKTAQKACSSVCSVHEDYGKAFPSFRIQPSPQFVSYPIMLKLFHCETALVGPHWLLIRLVATSSLFPFQSPLWIFPFLLLFLLYACMQIKRVNHLVITDRKTNIYRCEMTVSIYIFYFDCVDIDWDTKKLGTHLKMKK